MSTIIDLTNAIAAVCPIYGVSGDRASLRIDFRDEATPEQRAAAEAIAASFDWDAQSPPEQVTKRQLLHWLEFDHGVDDPEAAIVAAITAHVPEAQRAFALKDWARTYYVKFSNPLVPLLAQALGIANVAQAFREMEEKYG